MRRIAALLAATTLATATALLLTGSTGAAPGSGGPGGQAPPNTNGSDITVRAEVYLTGDLRGGSGARTVSVPPTCWWESMSLDAEGFLAWYDNFLASIHNHSYASWGLPSHSEVEKAIQQQRDAGKPVNWYQWRCQDDTPYEEVVALNQNDIPGFQGVPSIFLPALQGDPVPPPAVGVEDLRDIALAEMRLLQPVMARAPAVGRPTVVRLPTWFWATPDDVKTKLVRAQVQNVFAEVRADSLSIEFASTAAAPSRVACADAEALVEWSRGMSEDASSCTLTFPQTSGRAGQFTVTATNTWFADWHSSQDPAFQPVPEQPAPQVAQLQLQVAETQVVGGN